MSGIFTYLGEVKEELLVNTSWPTWKELQSSSLIVLFATFIVAIIIFAMDSSFKFVVSDIIYNQILNG